MPTNELIRISEQEVIKLGVSVSYKGFYYLVFAIVFAVEIGLRKINLNKEIYDRIAYLNDVTRESVEKCIRNCLVKAWQNQECEYIKTLSPNGKRPTNGELIALISNRIRLERGSGF